METIRKTQDYDLFTGVSAESINKIQKNLIGKVISKGQYLYHIGDRPEGIIFTTFGKFYCSLPSMEGREYFCDLISGGQSFGVRETIADSQFVNDCYAIESSYIQILPKEIFLDIFAKDLNLCRNVARVMSQNTITSQLNRFLDTQAVEVQLAKTTSSLADRFGEACNHGIRIHMHLTHDELAFMVHTSRQTVSKLFNQWHKQGWIDHNYGNVVVTNIRAIENICRKDYMPTKPTGNLAKSPSICLAN